MFTTSQLTSILVTKFWPDRNSATIQKIKETLVIIHLDDDLSRPIG